MEKKYYWLKLKEDFFRDKRIKKLRNIAGGDTYTIIYLKMQLLSLRDEGNLYFENVEDTFVEELALELDEEIENVKVCLMYLIKNGLIEQIDENTYGLIETKSCIGSETNKAEMMRKLRDKRRKNIENGNNVTEVLPDVTKCYTEIEIEKEIDIEKENIIKEKSKIFQKPTLDEIKNYCLERNNDVDYERFYDFYESKGWYVGKNKMKDWKACVRTWEKEKNKKQQDKELDRLLELAREFDKKEGNQR